MIGQCRRRLNPSARMVLCESGEHGFKIRGAVVAQAMDKEGGSSGDAATRAASEVFSHAGGMCACQDFAQQATGIKTQRFGVLGQVFILERLLVFVKGVMHFPEAALRP